MKFQFENIDYEYLTFYDIEYDNTSLVQFAAIILRRSNEPYIYEIDTNINLYIKNSVPLSNYFINYTHISEELLSRYGVDWNLAISKIEEVFHRKDNLIVGHNVNSDFYVFKQNDIDLFDLPSFCTYEKSKELGKTSHLTLSELAYESGYFIYNSHNAYNDVINTISVFANLIETKKVN